ncbi:MAG: hypothetical protein CMH65_11790 [Nevskiales bacterium]|nr:hypothetical protein [Nevskiales bacterium]
MSHSDSADPPTHSSVPGRAIHVYPPQPDAVNVYQRSMATAYAQLGLQVVPMTMESMLQTPLKRYDRVVINWPELRVLNARGGVSLPRWVYVNLWLRWVRSRCRQLVFVLHNHYAHDTTGAAQRATRALVERTRGLADRVVVHAPRLEGWDARHRYVPHPLYPTAAPETGTAFTASLGALEHCYLVFGVIAEYKRLHELLDCWPAEQPLLLVGKAQDAGYVDRLNAIIARRRLSPAVRVMPGFVSESEAALLLQRCKATLLLHDSAEMIASGSFFHAISYGATVLVRDRPWYQHIRSEFNQFHSFEDLPALVRRVAADEVARLDVEAVRAEATAAFGQRRLEQALRAALD